REFDVGALEFHMGMQPVESVGFDVDADGDGVVNEILIGELSALGVFVSTMERPFMERLGRAARRGQQTFADIGCVDCHKPALHTQNTHLPLRFPEERTRPFDHAYLWIDLTKAPPRFERHRDGGLTVPLYADLKRHDMGPGLAEDFSRADAKTNREFTTARLWGIADTAPYLHDGRATTLTDAVLMHGGEAQSQRDAFAALTDDEREDLLAFLRSLRTPEAPAEDLLRRLARPDHGDHASHDGHVAVIGNDHDDDSRDDDDASNDGEDSGSARSHAAEPADGRPRLSGRR
ncbi:MAG: di-heme oxidoredictase family protein, partial [Planctomycetota bacterium]